MHVPRKGSPLLWPQESESVMEAATETEVTFESYYVDLVGWSYALCAPLRSIYAPLRSICAPLRWCSTRVWKKSCRSLKRDDVILGCRSLWFCIEEWISVDFTSYPIPGK